MDFELPLRLKRFGLKILKGDKVNEGNFERFDFIYGQNVFESNWLSHYLIYKKFLELADRKPTLDICCGSGAGSKLICKTLSVPVCGIDYSETAVTFASQKNSDAQISYTILDLNKKTDIQTLSELIINMKLKQAFWIEGIEHVNNDEVIISTLRESGINRIFISTPIEKENSKPSGYHVNLFHPSKFHSFMQQHNGKLVTFLKYVDVAEAKTLRLGLSEEQIMEKYFTNDIKDGLNYLIELRF